MRHSRDGTYIHFLRIKPVRVVALGGCLRQSGILPDASGVAVQGTLALRCNPTLLRKPMAWIVRIFIGRNLAARPS